MTSATTKAFSALLISTSLLSGCMTASHLKEPVTPRDTPAMDILGTAIPALDKNSFKPKNGYQKLLPYLPYVIPVPTHNTRHALEPYKFSAYVTENDQPHALLYDDIFESMLVAHVTKTTTTKTITQLAEKSLKPFDAIVSKLSEKHNVKHVLSRSGYNTNKFTGAEHPYLANRYMVVSPTPIRSSDLRDNMLSAVYKRPTNPQTGMETLVKNQTFYVDIATWSDLALPSNIHVTAWVHPVSSNQSDENQWIDARTEYINADAFIHFEK